MKRLLGTILSITLLAGSVGAAQSDVNTAISNISADSALISGWVSDQLKFAVPFNSTTGNVVANQISLLGFEVGVEGQASSTMLDVNGFNNLPTSVINPQTISMFNRLPLAAVIGHLKVGLPYGLDFGVRYGGFPSTSFDNGSTHTTYNNTIWGLDLRKKIIEEGITRPFGLTMGLNFTDAKGSLTTSTPLSPLTSSGVTLTNATLSGQSDWDTKSVGVQAILDKQIAFFTPYVGASANKNFGNVTTNITTAGTVTSNGTSGTLTSSGSGAASPDTWDYRALAGFELTVLPLTKLGLGLEYAGNKNFGGSLGLRVQFH